MRNGKLGNPAIKPDSKTGLNSQRFTVCVKAIINLGVRNNTVESKYWLYTTSMENMSNQHVPADMNVTESESIGYEISLCLCTHE